MHGFKISRYIAENITTTYIHFFSLDPASASYHSKHAYSYHNNMVWVESLHGANTPSILPLLCTFYFQRKLLALYFEATRSCIHGMKLFFGIRINNKVINSTKSLVEVAIDLSYCNIFREESSVVKTDFPHLCKYQNKFCYINQSKCFQIWEISFFMVVVVCMGMLGSYINCNIL